jgi:tRNA (guanine37-N1)-methyltransferase
VRFSFVTIFDKLVSFYFDSSILARAVKNGLINIDFVNPRDFTIDGRVDEYCIGGGAGMLMMVEPIQKAIESIKTDNSHIVFLTPSSKKFNQNDAYRLSKKEHIIFVSGRYEGFDERALEIFADEVLGIGDYILTGGELASLVLTDAISRNIDGVLGNINSIIEESFNDNLLEAPLFTKPLICNDIKTPSILMSGNHSKIHFTKKQMAIAKTRYFRPDMSKSIH